MNNNIIVREEFNIQYNDSDIQQKFIDSINNYDYQIINNYFNENKFMQYDWFEDNYVEYSAELDNIFFDNYHLIKNDIYYFLKISYYFISNNNPCNTVVNHIDNKLYYLKYYLKRIKSKQAKIP